MIRVLSGAFALLLAAVLAPAALAQAPESQLSIGSNFVAGTCLETREADGAIVIDKCYPRPQQALRYDDQNGQIRQAEKCLTARARGEPLAMTPCSDGPAQKWNFQDGGMRNDTGVCADVLNFQRDPGTAVIAWDCTGTENQKFFATRVRMEAGAAPAGSAAAAGPAPTVENLAIVGQPAIASYFVQGRCLAFARGEVHIDNCALQPNQSFHFAGGVSGQIVQDGKCLTTGTKGGALTLDNCAARAEQDWMFTSEGVLRNRANLCADILNFDTKAGARVIGWDCTATDNQKFYPAIAARSGSFSLGAAVATNLRANSGVTTVSMTPGYSPYNITGAGARGLSADASGKISGGQNDTIILGGAGVLTVRFVNGLAASAVKAAGPGDILPKDWAFFSGATAGTIKP